jgi:predicted amidophosphoribosyltransferase
LPRHPETDLQGPAAGRCAACILTPPTADRVRAAVVYDAVARSILLRAKIGRRRELFGPLGTQLARTVECAGLGRAGSAVVAVPSHPLMTLRRGFSPAAELARPLARRLGLPLLRGALGRRIGMQTATKRLGARRRRTLGPVGIRLRCRVEGMRLLLVDDVMTTGSTVEACARLLKDAGAIEVSVAVWARTLPHDSGQFDPTFRGGS